MVLSLSWRAGEKTVDYYKKRRAFGRTHCYKNTTSLDIYPVWGLPDIRYECCWQGKIIDFLAIGRGKTCILGRESRESGLRCLVAILSNSSSLYFGDSRGFQPRKKGEEVLPYRHRDTNVQNKALLSSKVWSVSLAPVPQGRRSE